MQEFRSSRAAEKLRAMVHTTVTVLRKDLRKGIPEEVTRHFPVRLQYREPEKVEIPLARLVPGEVVALSAGDMIPADVRVISAKDLFVSQAALTGESLPVEKFPRPRAAAGGRRSSCRTSPSWAATSSAARRAPWSSPRAARPISAPSPAP